MYTYTEFSPQLVYIAINDELKKKWSQHRSPMHWLFEKLLESSSTLLSRTQDGLRCSAIKSLKCNPVLNVSNCLHLIHF